MAKTKKSENNKTKYNIFIIAVLVVVGLVLAVVSNEAANAENNDDSNTLAVVNDSPSGPQAAEKDVTVELYHFHGTHQCTSCTRLGELAEKTVETYFADEIESGDLVFGHINYDLPENKELAKKFGVTGSSLWIGTTIGDEFNKEENINVWYKLNDEADYMGYLKGILDKRLVGELK